MRLEAARRRVPVEAESAEPARIAPPGLRTPAEGVSEPTRPGPSRKRHALQILLLWTGVGLFFAAQRYLRAPSLQPPLAQAWWKSLAGSLVTAYIWAALTPSVMGVARRLRPRRGTLLRTVPLLVLAGAAASLLHLTATNVFWQVVEPLPGSRDFIAMFLATLEFGGAARLATYFGLVGVTWAIDDFRTYREKELQASELERELVQTQLEALKLRLHPQFLFNALATILPLIRTEPRAAARTVVQLGDILRLALHNDATGLVPLKTELEYIRLYLQIEQTRLRDRLEVQFSIDPEALDAAVPNLILLPLIEGAIANGVSVRPGKARIGILARPESGALRLSVRESTAEDEVPLVAFAIDESFVQKTKLRLELLYPGRHSIGISDRLEKGHEVEFALPLSTSRPAAEGAA